MACGSLGAGVARAQAGTTAVPQFEVVSVKEVKPSDAESGGSTINSRLPDRFVATHITLFFLVLEAYELKGHQLVGAPDWTWDKAYNVIGTYPDGKRPPAHVIHLMLQQLLAERFGLKVHREQRELPAYDLVVARKDGRLGPQIHESGMDCKAWVAAGRPKTASDRPNPVAPGEERPVCTMFTTRTWMSGGARAMTDLAGRLEALVDRPVADKTGLTGAYDIDLQWDPADLHIAQPGAGTSEAPSLFTALEEQLGLKLVAHREMTDVVVIDGIKPAGPN
jgi:uncharacterized protein (TIGR03435 family)